MDREADTTVHNTSFLSFFSRYVDQHAASDISASHRLPSTAKAYHDTDDVTNAVMTCGPAKTGKKMFGCPLCRYATDRKNNLKRHLMTMHRERTAEFAHLGATTTTSPMNCFGSTAAFANRKQRRSISDDDDFDAYNNRCCIRCNSTASYRSSSPVRISGGRNHHRDELSPKSIGNHRIRRAPADDDNATRAELQFGVSLDRRDDENLSEYSGRLQTGSTFPRESEETRGKTVTGCGERVAAAADVSVRGCWTGGSGRALGDRCERFEPRPVLAYRRPSSRMFFYSRLRSTHIDQ